MQMARENANDVIVPPYRKSEFFSSLSAPALADFESLLHPTSYPAGVVLFTETQPAAGIVSFSKARSSSPSTRSTATA